MDRMEADVPEGCEDQQLVVGYGSTERAWIS